jgi:CHAT domain
MPILTYDNFEIAFRPRADGAYDMDSLPPDGSKLRTTFTVPFTPDQLESAVVTIARSIKREAPFSVGTIEEAEPDDVDVVDAKAFGTALGEALFANGVGKSYDDAVRDAGQTLDRGLRLTLSLGDAPALLSLPWEFLFRRPLFIASQRHTPVVRQLDVGSRNAAPRIPRTIRVLGIVSNPTDSPLDVKAERRRVRKAMAKMTDAKRVELDWLEPATLSSLREKLRDKSYHIIHYVGHGSFTSTNQGTIYLVDDAGRSKEVDNTELANLLGDQRDLRLVVLNSCEGARTALGDPYAGVATTLIQLGVPAVVAMQFEISDPAAILFAGELYTNLINNRMPIDAAVAEGRKAIYTDLDSVEWATPVLFVRDPELQLFDFAGDPGVEVEGAPPRPQSHQGDGGIFVDMSTHGGNNNAGTVTGPTINGGINIGSPPPPVRDEGPSQ